MNVLLDTCTFLWLALQPNQLSDIARRQIDDSDRLFLSMAGIWEITFKNSAGKMPLPSPPRDWVPSRMSFFQVELLPMDSEVVLLSGELPAVHHDPFDRLLVAQAILSNLPVISPDAPLSSLGARRIW
jgi:PIN domain nuclease of toxin-antitoxin system